MSKWIDNKFDVSARTFTSIVDSHGLIQHINSVTQTGYHTLDLVIPTKSSCGIVRVPSVYDLYLCRNKGKSFHERMAV